MPQDVDFYHNPTELFQWINYRRWQGAINRAQSCPDEIMTWIVGRDLNSDTVLWRRLPIHLICMQPKIPYGLLEVLLKKYPESATCQDQEGMTPLHLACLMGGITAKISSLLLTYDPAVVMARDRHGKTPTDILSNSMTELSDDVQASEKVLNNMVSHLNRIQQGTIDEEHKSRDILAQSEYLSAQKHIVHLEEQLNEKTQALRKLEAEVRSNLEEDVGFQYVATCIEEQLNIALKDKQSLVHVIEKLRQEMSLQQRNLVPREDDTTTTSSERSKVQEQIDNLNSKVSTAQTEMGSLEKQLKTKRSENNRLCTQVNILETSLEQAKGENSNNSKKAISLEKENQRLKVALETLTKCNLSLQAKTNDFSRSWADMLVSLDTLAVDNKCVLYFDEQQKHDFLDLVHAERSEFMKMLTAQRKSIEDLFLDQRQLLGSDETTDSSFQTVASNERQLALLALQSAMRKLQDSDEKQDMHQIRPPREQVGPLSKLGPGRASGLLKERNKDSRIREHQSDSFGALSGDSTVSVSKPKVAAVKASSPLSTVSFYSKKDTMTEPCQSSFLRHGASQMNSSSNRQLFKENTHFPQMLEERSVASSMRDLQGERESISNFSFEVSLCEQNEKQIAAMSKQKLSARQKGSASTLSDRPPRAEKSLSGNEFKEKEQVANSKTKRGEHNVGQSSKRFIKAEDFGKMLMAAGM